MVKRGQLVLVDLDGRVGSCQRGLRPAVVLQNDLGNKYSGIVTVVPITTKEKRVLPVHSKLNNSYDLAKGGNIMLAEQITVVDKTQIIREGDCLKEEDIIGLNQAVIIQLGLTGIAA